MQDTTEEQIRRALKTHTTRGEITERALKKELRKATKMQHRTGWTTTFAAWAGEMEVKVKEYSIAPKQVYRVDGRAPRTSSREDRRDLTRAAESEGAKTAGVTKAAVIRWVNERCEQRGGEWQVEASQMRTMKKNMHAGSMAVKAAIVILIAEGRIEIEDREKARGRGDRTGGSNWIAKNRVPPMLAKTIAKAMWEAAHPNGCRDI